MINDTEVHGHLCIRFQFKCDVNTSSPMILLTHSLYAMQCTWEYFLRIYGNICLRITCFLPEEPISKLMYTVAHLY